MFPGSSSVRDRIAQFGGSKPASSATKKTPPGPKAKVSTEGAKLRTKTTASAPKVEGATSAQTGLNPSAVSREVVQNLQHAPVQTVANKGSAFNLMVEEKKPEAFDAKSTWKRAAHKASIVGRGSSQETGSAGRTLHAPYWKEKLDPRHRDAGELAQLQNRWERDPEGGRDFFAWLEKNDVDLPHRTAVQQVSSKRERAKHRASFDADGQIKMNDRGKHFLFGHKTGEAIFVADHKDNLYVGVKTLGKFHHSSFLAGDAAQTAGTLRLEDGKLTQINDHSGHYRPGKNEMKAMIGILSAQGVDPSTYTVKTQARDEMSAVDFLKL